MDEFGEQLYVYGGPAVGSVTQSNVSIHPLTHSTPFAIYMDVTHDNKPPHHEVGAVLLIVVTQTASLVVYYGAQLAHERARVHDQQWIWQHSGL
jgi:hypothetical protein